MDIGLIVLLVFMGFVLCLVLGFIDCALEVRRSKKQLQKREEIYVRYMGKGGDLPW